MTDLVRGTGAAEHRSILAQRIRHLVRVDQPLVVISQAPRSGGTLLLRLFDGHPQCHTVPHELGKMFVGMRAVAGDPRRAWEHLTPHQQSRRLASGFRQAKRRLHGDKSTLPFLLPPRLQRSLFDACLRELQQPDVREVMNCYFTAYFNAWLDNGNLRGSEKRWIVGFEPGSLTHSDGKQENLAAVYPDGRVISIVRDPFTWYASARRWGSRWRDLDPAVDEWRAGAEGALRWQDEDPARIRIVAFDDLVGRTEATMRDLAVWLGIEFGSALLEPTFNGWPVAANSSFEDPSTSVSRAPLERGQSELSGAERARIEKRAGDVYERALARSTIY